MRKHRWRSNVANRFFSTRIKMAIFILICCGLSLSFFSLNLDQGRHRYKVGDVAREVIVASQAIQDGARTKALQEQAVSMVLPVEYVEPVILIEVRKDLDKIFDAISASQEAFPEDSAAATEFLMKQPMPTGVRLTASEAAVLIASDAKVVSALRNDLSDLLTQSLSKGVTLNQLETERAKLSETVTSLREYSEVIRGFGSRCGSALLRPNRFIDQNVTELRREEARESVEPVMLPKGTVIAPSGTVLTETHIEYLRDAGMLVQDTKERGLQLVGICIVAMVSVMYLTSFFYSRGGMLKEPRLTYLVGVLMVLMLGISLMVNEISPWLYPFGFFPMLVTLLADFGTAAILNTFLVFLIGVFYQIDASLLAVLWFSGFAAAISIRKAEQRSALFMAGVNGALVGIALVIGIGLSEGLGIKETLTNCALVGIAGLAGSVLLLGSMPVWEIGFKVLTPITLLELSNPNHPLLKKLLLEAPGTYHHSILVGNLSESAAHAVGANALLTRVASFYHDIGKVQMPHFFVENQMGEFNPHENMAPEVSVKVIRDHVDNGMRLAEEYHLPREIKDIIEQHHGNSLIRFFFHKASQENEAEPLNQDNYSYRGRTPRTKESAIVMLADSVEAAVRSLPEIKSETVKTMIDKIFQEKLSSGQLSLSPLTFAELTIIAERFEAILAGVYHARIQYPDIKEPSKENKTDGTDH